MELEYQPAIDHGFLEEILMLDECTLTDKKHSVGPPKRWLGFGINRVAMLVDLPEVLTVDGFTQ